MDETKSKEIIGDEKVLDSQAQPKTVDVTCIMTVHKRPHTAARQLAAIEAQSVKPASIQYWHNYAGPEFDKPAALDGLAGVSTSFNYGVWPRFLFAMECQTEYVCVFDDDTIPGSCWLENCLNTMKTHEGMLGTIGVFFPDERGRRRGHKRVGWAKPNEVVREVDLVGHSWFFKRDWLRYYALEPRVSGPTCGEDYHFSVALQKHLGLGTYVPPHPAGDMSLWGSVEGHIGKEDVALYLQEGEGMKKRKMHNKYLKSGWKPMSLRSDKG